MTPHASRNHSATAGILFVIGFVTLAALAACSPQPPASKPGEPGAGSGTSGGAPPTDILVVEQSELEAMRAKYVLSEPRGDISAAATCNSGQADKACTDAARQQLRDEAKKRGMNLVVISSSIMRQTYPPQLVLRATLYEIRPRA